MADFVLTQTDAQVQSILNDAQDAMGAGAQTSLTTDYIMLKGTNGRYHKILKDSFTEAVRNTLAGLLVNNDKGTTISQIAAIASGDFGSITPANLASVLGVMRGETLSVEAGSYATMPFTNYQCGILLIKPTNNAKLSFFVVPGRTSIDYDLTDLSPISFEHMSVMRVDSGIKVSNTMITGTLVFTYAIIKLAL